MTQLNNLTFQSKELRETVQIDRHFAITPQAFCNYIFFLFSYVIMKRNQVAAAAAVAAVAFRLFLLPD